MLTIIIIHWKIIQIPEVMLDTLSNEWKPTGYMKAVNVFPYQP